MKLLEIIFVLLAYAIVKSAFLVETAVDAPEFPSLDTPEVEFREISSCNELVLCLNSFVDVMFNIAAGVLFAILFVTFLLLFIGQMVVVIVALQFAGVGGPPWIDLLLATPYLAGLAIIVFKMARKGDTNA